MTRARVCPFGIAGQAGPVIAALGIGFSVWMLATRSVGQAGALVTLVAAGPWFRVMRGRHILEVEW